MLGGANVAGPMGGGLASVFTWIDHFFNGEADIEFPDFCERLVRDNTKPQGRIIDCRPIEDMRVVAMPDFSDYFSLLREFQGKGQLPAELPDFLTMECSRGCWWGEKHHCTFCGLNGEGMEFRKKPADRAFEEIQTLTQRWNVQRFAMADNIMPLSYLDDLLPRLAEWPDRPGLFFEVKANLRDAQLRLMAQAGIDRIQPGINSFSSHVLKLMRKGVSALPMSSCCAHAGHWVCSASQTIKRSRHGRVPRVLKSDSARFMRRRLRSSRRACELRASPLLRQVSRNRVATARERPAPSPGLRWFGRSGGPSRR